MEKFYELISLEEYNNALKTAAIIEISDERLDSQFFSSYLACFLLIEDLDGARYLWRRAPKSLKPTGSGNETELSAVWTIGKYLWQNEYPKAIAFTSECSFSSTVSSLMEKLRDALRRNILQNYSKAYSSVPLSALSETLQLSSEDTITECQALGWVVDSDGYVLPKKVVVAASVEDVKQSMTLISDLSLYAAEAEKKTLYVDLSNKQTSSSSTSSTAP